MDKNPETASWEDDAFWRVTVTEADLPEFVPYQVGNGRVGVRVGPMVLDWNGDTRPLLAQDGPDFWGRLNPRMLFTLAKFAYDGGNQIILPAWNQVRLKIGDVEYAEGNGRHRLRNTLDLRNGEASSEDAWEYRPGHTVLVRVRLVIPRSRPCAAWYELSVEGLDEPALLGFGLNAAQVAETFSNISFDRRRDTIVGTYTPRHQQRNLIQGLRWESEGWQETESGADGWVSLSTQGSAASLTVVHSVHCRSEADVRADLASLDAPGREETAAASGGIWGDLWASGLNFQHANRDWERLVLTNQYYLLINLEEGSHYPMGPLGLSRPGWHGSQMWDADFWLFRAVLPLWPGLARSIVGFRLAMLPAAKANARAQGFRGAFYPWLSDDEGRDITPAHYRNEIHNNAWIGLAAWEAAGTPPDKSILTELTWPILEGLADFFVSRGERDPDGAWHIRGVLPPDEGVAEGHRTNSGTCDDNVLTNVGVRAILRNAAETARLLGHAVPAEWIEMATHLVILPADANGVIPEYLGYNGHPIKQADTILAFYPFQLDPGAGIFKRTLDYYHDRTDRGGPLMTTQIEALLTMLHGDRERGLEHLFTEYRRYVRGPHFIPFETPDNANSIMLTGIGGLLQALIFGWFGATLEDTDAIPRLGRHGGKAERKRDREAVPA